MAKHIENGAIKVIELIGVSSESFEDAVQQAVTKASKSIKGITGVEVRRQTAKVRDGHVVEYHTNLKLAFAVE